MQATICTIRGFLPIFLLLMVTSAVHAVASAEEADIPKFKWSQDEDTLYITIEVPCKNETIDIAADKDFFGFSCVSLVDGKKKTLAFSPREDIVAETAKCAGKERAYETCTLKKVHRHYFDRLWAPEDDKKLTAKAKVDWKAMNDEEAEDFLGYSTKHVKSLDEQALDKLKAKAKKKRMPLVVDVSFPWCSKCKDTRDMFEVAARKLHKKAYFGYVDAREERRLSRSFQTDCTHVCTYHVLPQGEAEFTEVEAKSGEKSSQFIKKLERHLKPALTAAKNIEAIRKAASKFGAAIVSTFHTAKHPQETLAMRKASMQFRDAAFMQLSDKKAAKALGGEEWVYAVMKKNKKVVLPFPRDQELTESNLIDFAKKAIAPPLTLDYTFEKRLPLEKSKIPVAKIYVKETMKNNDPFLSIIKRVSKKFQGRIATLVCSTEPYHMDMVDAGLPKDKFPAIAIHDKLEGRPPESLRYAYVAGVVADDFSEESVSTFYSEYLQGKLHPSFKSQPDPGKKWQHGTVMEVVHSMLGKKILGYNHGMDDVVGDVVLMAYKNWSPNKDKHNATMERLATILKDTGIVVATFDSYENFFDNQVFQVEDEHWQECRVYLIAGGEATPEVRKPILVADGSKESSLPLTQGNILKQLKAKLPEIQQEWNTIKDNVAEVRRQVAEEKERNKKEAEEAKKQAEEEAEKLEEKLKSIPKIDCTKDEDNGVIKQTIKEGTGDVPKKGDQVEAHYTGTLLDGTKFDSSRDRDETFKFPLGASQVIRCWDMAFATMKVWRRRIEVCVIRNKENEKETLRAGFR